MWILSKIIPLGTVTSLSSIQVGRSCTGQRTYTAQKTRTDQFHRMNTHHIRPKTRLVSTKTHSLNTVACIMTVSRVLV